MKQEEFERAHAPLWRAFEAWLARDALGSGAGPAPPDALADGAVPQRYRVLCQHLALARDRGYSADLVERLNQLALRGHRLLYGTRVEAGNRVLDFITDGFPRAVRAERRFAAAAALLLFGPFLLLIVALGPYPDLVYYFIPPAEVAKYEEMYSPTAEHLGRTRSADSAFYMFGIYIWNNVRIGFQTFAGGLVFGLGAVLALVFNGIALGAVAGHLTHAGYALTFWTFVSGHSAFELTAIALSGAGGLRLGAALVAPGRLSRKAALVAAAHRAGPVVYGAAGMLVLAAVIEAFWSSVTTLAPQLKWGVGAVLWVLTLAYFTFTGRRRGS
ncbi:MAG: stage II sporulation protein M [Burkholderiales bacterium]